MHKSPKKSALSLATECNILALVALVGDAPVLKYEVDTPLFLLVETPSVVAKRPGLVYQVCDGLPGQRDKIMDFDDITFAIAMYDRVRKSGSWKDFVEDYPQFAAQVREC